VAGTGQRASGTGLDPFAGAPALLRNGDLRLRPCRYGYMLYSVNDRYIGRSLELYGEYGEAEFVMYRWLVRPGQVVVDAGANIGTHSLFFARAVQPGGAVVAFEPQRVLFQMLCGNLAINGLRNVDARQAGVGAAPATMQAPPLDYGRESNFGGVRLVPEDEAGAGPRGETVPIVPIDGLGLERCDLIKLDVEGMEREALLGARRTVERHRPAIYLENNIRERSPALIRTLLDFGYRLYWHLPYLFNPQNLRGNAENVFGRTINANMLCLPPGDRREVELDPVEGVDDWWRASASDRSEDE
jgi:FkbM family methyltransferase